MVVDRILSKQGIDHKPVGSYFQIRCLSPDHDDKNPSMFVNKYSGWANCKSCGASYNIFSLFNEKPNKFQMQKDMFREKIRKVLSESTFYEIPEDAVFYETSFRGIRSEVIREFQAFQFNEFPGYLFFPLKNHSGKVVNFIGRETTGNKMPKYMFLYKKPVLMAPYTAPNMGSIILVEGWFDFLNLYQNGLTNVRALFGLVFTERHVEMLKMENIDEVIIMMDADEAGKAAAKEIKELLDKEFISNKIITLKDGSDPGELTHSTISKLKEKLYGRSYCRDEAE